MANFRKIISVMMILLIMVSVFPARALEGEEKDTETVQQVFSEDVIQEDIKAVPDDTGPGPEQEDPPEAEALEGPEAVSEQDAELQEGSEKTYTAETGISIPAETSSPEDTDIYEAVQVSASAEDGRENGLFSYKEDREITDGNGDGTDAEKEQEISAEGEFIPEERRDDEEQQHGDAASETGEDAQTGARQDEDPADSGGEETDAGEDTQEVPQKEEKDEAYCFELTLIDVRDHVCVYKNGEKVAGIFGNSSPGEGHYFLAGEYRPEIMYPDSDGCTRISFEGKDGDIFRVEADSPSYAVIRFYTDDSVYEPSHDSVCAMDFVLDRDIRVSVDGDYSGSAGYWPVGRRGMLRSSPSAPVMPDSMYFWLGDSYDDYSSTAIINGHTGVYFFHPSGGPSGLYVSATCGNTYKHMESGTHYKVARIAEWSARQYLDYGGGCCSERDQRALAWLIHHGQTEYDWRIANEEKALMGDGRLAVGSQLEAYTITFLATWVLTNDGRTGDYGTVYASNGAAALDGMFGSAFSSGLPYSTRSAIDRMVSWALQFADRHTDPNAAVDEYLETFVYSDGYGDHQPLLVGAYRGHAYGDLTIKKSSSDPEYTDGNAMYSLEGTEFEICDANGNYAGTLTADAEGNTGTLTLTAGTYRIIETKSGKGYVPDSSVKTVTVTAYETNVFQFSNEPVTDPATLHLAKWDRIADRFVPQGEGSFAGAQYRMDYYDNTGWHGEPKASWVFETDGNGTIMYLPEYLVEGDGLYCYNGAYLLPLGSVRITEIKAPEGYLMSSDELRAVITQEEGRGRFIWTGRTLGLIKAYDDMTGIPEVPERGALMIGKRDGATGLDQPQGDGRLDGAEFTVFAASDMEVGGVMCRQGDAVLTLITDENGIARTLDRELPYGSYYVMETKAPEGYLINQRQKAFRIRRDGQVVDLTGEKDIIDEALVKGGAVFRKADNLTGGIPQGCATLRGAEITIYNASQNPVFAGGEMIGTGEAVCVISTDDEGYAATEEKFLPYGTYTARETRASEGYELNEDWSVTFCIRKDGETADLTEESVLQEQVIRGDLLMLKTDAEGNAMAGIPFMIVALDREGNEIERHVIVTDQDGIIDTSSASRPHTNRTNFLDGYTDGAVFVSDSMLDSSVGVWFGGGEPDDSLGALPYGAYRVYELQCGLTYDRQMNMLESGIETVDGEHRTAVFDTMADLSVEMGSKACWADTGLDIIPESDGVHVSDTVTYTSLTAGRRYTLETRFVLRSDIMKELARVETDFFPGPGEEGSSASAGTVNADAVIDAAGLSGETVVAMDRIYQYVDGKRILIASHEDPDDESQMLRVPQIRTMASDKDTGDGSGKVSEEAGIRDTVMYANLCGGETFRLRAELIDPVSGETVSDTEGNACGAEKVFVCGYRDGSAEMPVIVLDSTAYTGRSVVVTEDLYLITDDGEILITSHRDPEDTDQTVTYPEIHTIAMGKDTNDHAAPVSEHSEITDTVKIKGILPVKEYALTACLAYKNDFTDREGILHKAGEVIAKTEKTFFAQADETEEETEFLLDSNMLEGASVIVTEELWHNGVLIASHDDLTDEEQSIYFPLIMTKARDEKNGTQFLSRGEETVFTDTVSCGNLLPGRKYKVRGTLVNRFTGMEMGPVSESGTFTAEGTDAELTLQFTADTESVGCFTAVVFERLYLLTEEGEELLLNAHEDLGDEEQTLYLPAVFTKAEDAGSRTYEARALCIPRSGIPSATGISSPGSHIHLREDLRSAAPAGRSPRRERKSPHP